MRPPLFVIAAALTLGAALSALPAQMAGAQSPSTSVLVPPSGATLSGSTYLDASASNATSVEFLLFGGTYGYSAPVVCTATPTYYGWICAWNTTTVPNGSYALVSEATGPGGSAFSSPISITVDNLSLHTQVLVPTTGAVLSGSSTVLDASASGPSAITGVQFVVTGGSLSNDVVGTATQTLYGWIALWNTTTVPAGAYTLQSIATEVGGQTAVSTGVDVTVVPTVSFGAAVEFPFSSGQAVGLVLSQSSSNTVQVNFMGTDGPEVTIQCCEWIGAASSFTPSSGMVTFAPGQTSASVTLTVSPTTVTGCSIVAPACYPSLTMTLVDPTNAVIGSMSTTNVFYEPAPSSP